MTKIEWLELACNKLGAPTMSYCPEIAIKEYEQRMQEVTKILHEVIKIEQEEKERIPPKG